MEKNRIPLTEFTIQAILVSDFKYDSFLENDIGARQAIEKVTNKAIVDYSQEPVQKGKPHRLIILKKQNNMMMLIKSNSYQITSLKQEVELLESDITTLKITTKSYFEIHSWFVVVFFLR